MTTTYQRLQAKLKCARNRRDANEVMRLTEKINEMDRKIAVWNNPDGNYKKHDNHEKPTRRHFPLEIRR